MVINHLHRVRVTVNPLEADPPLSIDSNAILPLPISRKLFQSVGGRNPYILKRARRIDHREFPQGQPLKLSGEAPRELPPPNPFGLLASEAPNHPEMLIRSAFLRNRSDSSGLPRSNASMAFGLPENHSNRQGVAAMAPPGNLKQPRSHARRAGIAPLSVRPVQVDDNV